MIPDVHFPFGRVILRMEGRGKQGRFRVLTGQCDHDFSGKTFRLFPRYCYLRKITGDYLFQKKNSGKYLPEEV